MKKLHLLKLALRALLLNLVLNSCNNPDTESGYKPEFATDTTNQKVIVMGFPNFSYSENSTLLIQYLNAHLSGTIIKVHACVDWGEFVSFLNQGKFDMTLTNGIVATQSIEKGYSISGKISGTDPYTSLIITKKNSGITSATDLKGKKIALVPSNIIPSTMMGLYFLYQNGLDVNMNIHKENVASFEAGLLSVYMGKSDAAICPRRNWNIYVKAHPEILTKVEIKWETPALEQNAVLIKNTIDMKTKSDLMDLLFSMQTTKEGKAALDQLDINGFEKADKSNYQPMLDFKRKYDSVIFQ
jgi:ABC-type phosphate/phosphonate transport system substrate-binding protein